MKQLVLVLLLFAIPHFSAAQRVISLFEQHSLAKTATKFDYELERSIVQFHSDIFNAGALNANDIIQLPNTDEYPTEYKVLGVTSFSPTTFSVRAVATDGSFSYIAYTVQQDRFFGVLQDVSLNQKYFLGVETDMTPYFSKIYAKGLDELQCSIDEVDLRTTVAAKQSSSSGAATSSDWAHDVHAPVVAHTPFSSLEDDHVTIDLMLVYTPKAKLWAEENQTLGTIDIAIAQAMNLSQLGVDNSNVFITFRVVDIYQAEYDEDTSNSNTTLSRMQNPVGAEATPFVPVHQRRDEFGADLVCLFVRISDTGGLGYVLNNYGGQQNIGFNLNRIQQTHFGYTLVHEIGHNMGNSHGRIQGSSPASINGSLFQFSTGWRWVGGNEVNYHSIMTYPDGAVQAPLFSNPDITFQSVPSGAYAGNGAPADNARSMRYSKRVIAFNRLSQVSSPTATAPATIELSVRAGETKTETITITNSGDSELLWDADFELASNAKASIEHFGETSDELHRPVDLGDNTQAGDLHEMQEAENGVYFTANFETAEGFGTGFHRVLNGFRSMSDNVQFEISEDASASGAKHLRLGYQALLNNGTYLQVNSPFQGVMPFGAYEVSFSMRISGDASTVFIDLFDAKRGSMSAGMAFQGANNFLFNPTTNNYSRTDEIWSRDAWINVRITLDPVTQVVTYFFNDTQIGTRIYGGGRAIDRFTMYIQNNPNNYLDIDNIQFKYNYLGIEGVRIQKDAGTIPAGQTGTIPFALNGLGLTQGYVSTGLLRLRSTDPDNFIQFIPVTMTVDSPTSLESGTGKAGAFELMQNFPNPFNPVTTIRYRLDQATTVKLTVYDVLGRQVRVLVNDRMGAGNHEVMFNAQGLSSGVYMYRLDAGGQTQQHKMILLK